MSYSKWHFYVFDAKKCSCDPPIKNFPIFALDPTRPYLDWQPKAILTSQPIYDPFKCDFEWRPKCKIGLNVNLPKNRQAEKNSNVPLDALMCPLPIINDIEPLSSTLHGANTHFIHHPSNVENYSIGHKSETGEPKKKKVHPSYIFIHLSANFGVKIQNTHCYRNWATFSTSHQSALNGPGNNPGWHTQKSKIG